MRLGSHPGLGKDTGRGISISEGLQLQGLHSRHSPATSTTVDHSGVSPPPAEVSAEVVVWTDAMDITTTDTETPVDTPGSTLVPNEDVNASPPTPTPVLSGLTTRPDALIAEDAQDLSFGSSMSVLSEPSETSALSTLSSKATTPADHDSSRELPIQPPPPVPVARAREIARRKYDVRPKVSIPSDLAPHEYAMQCIAAAESSRLNPYALHEEEYVILRDHISHAQVTTYLNIRNGILRLWVRNPQIAVTREEAVGCAKDSRWFDVANVSFEWLVRRGFINFGCLEIKSSRRPKKQDLPRKERRKTIVVVGAGMSGLSCARQLEGLAKQYHKKFRDMGEELPEVVVLEGRDRIGGRVYSRAFKTKPSRHSSGLTGKRFTAEMGGMIITGFDRGNPLNVLVRGQLSLPYHNLLPETTLYDSNGRPVDQARDLLVEKLFNDCLDRVSEFKFKPAPSKLIEGNREMIDEGKDSSAEGLNKTIAIVEETTAAQPHAPPVSEQNIAPQVDLVPVSSDRLTGRVHVEPGTPGTLKASFKAKLMGWALKPGVTEDQDIDLEVPTKRPGATLGSVTDHVISQFKDMVDLNPQDFRLINWHVANLEYSNATNYNQLSLPGWDIDAGNEWEGKHSMIVGGYQSVPRGLMLCPTPLDVRRKSPVTQIKYSPDNTGRATVECEDGFSIEADYVVSTIPLGVLKHGNVAFDPPLPPWKTDAIARLGFGVLNKVILVYQHPFWDEKRDIFGVLRNPPNRHSLNQSDYSSQRGRFFQWFNVTNTSGLPCLLALMAGDAGFDTEQTCNDDLVAEATTVLRSVFGPSVPDPIETVVTRWASDKFARGSYSSAGPGMRADDYDVMARPVGNLLFAGEHTTGTHPATVHGAYLTGLRAASEVVDRMLGPIDVPVPLVIPRESSSSSASSSSSLKRKSTDKDPAAARAEAYEIALWDSIIAQIGLRPLKPTKPAMNAYLLYSKQHFDAARKRCEEGNAHRRPGKGSKASANEVRVMSAKMWRECPPEERKPYEAAAAEQKAAYQKTLEGFNAAAAEWDRRATELKGEYERQHPFVPGPGDGVGIGIGEGEGGRRSKSRLKSYAESEGSDVGMEG